MNLAPKTKKTLVILGTLVLVTGIAFVAVLTVIIRNAESKPPWFHAYSNGHAVKVEPVKYCSIAGTDCTDGPQAELHVPLGGSVQISLPDEISSAVWVLTTEFKTPDGEFVMAPDRVFRPNEVQSLNIKSDADPPLQLSVIEIRLPSADTGGDDQYVARAYWSIKID